MKGLLNCQTPLRIDRGGLLPMQFSLNQPRANPSGKSQPFRVGKSISILLIPVRIGEEFLIPYQAIFSRAG
jgi:hypothetical protein